MKLVTGLAVAFTLAASQIAATHGNTPKRLRAVSYHSDNILGTSADFTFVGGSAEGGVLAERVALAEIERLRQVLSSWDDQSELSQLFARGSLEHPSQALLSVLRQYEMWNARSGQAYSARVGQLSALWQQAAKSGSMPTETTLAAAVVAIAGPAWRIEKSGRIVALTTQRPDLNSLGKGFIIDRALQIVRDSVPDVQGALINIGGDVHVWGVSPENGAWYIGVANPLRHADNAKPLVRITLRDGAVSSSGDYERGYTIGSHHYSHIIDPRTGQPAVGVIGATVIAPNNETANALATILSVLPVDSGMALVRSVEGAEALVVTDNGTRVQTPGFAAYVQTSPAASNAQTQAVIGATLEVDITPMTYNRHAPYTAVWITDTTGKHIRTLAFWGDRPKYLRELSRWWALNQSDYELINSVTRATRRAGKYSLEWNGLDQKGGIVPAGSYLFWLEVAYENGAHSSKSVAVACGSTEATAVIPQAAAFAGADIRCGPAKP